MRRRRRLRQDCLLHVKEGEIEKRAFEEGINNLSQFQLCCTPGVCDFVFSNTPQSESGA